MSIEVVALLLSGLAIVISLVPYWGRENVKLKLADTIGPVIGTDGGVSAIQIACTFENSGFKAGSVQHMDLTVKDPSGNSQRFDWGLFIEYRFDQDTGKLQIIPLGEPHAIPIRANDTGFALVQFNPAPDRIDTDFTWREGKYRLEIRMLINAKYREQDPRFTACSVQVTPRFLARIAEKPEEPETFRLPILTWDAD